MTCVKNLMAWKESKECCKLPSSSNLYKCAKMSVYTNTCTHEHGVGRGRVRAWMRKREKEYNFFKLMKKADAGRA